MFPHLYRRSSMKVSRRMRRQSLLAGLLVVAISLSGTACATNQGADTARDNKTVLTVGVTSAPVSLNPVKADWDGGTQVMGFLTNESLLTLNSDGTVGPGLATSFRYTGDGSRTLELVLRHDARFSDGAMVTAQAVKTWLEYFSKTPGPHQTNIALQSVDAVDQWTVRINLASPNPLVPLMLAGGYLWGSVSSPGSVENPQTLERTTAGAGQYMLDVAGTVAGDHYTLVPNNFYYDKSRVHFSKIIVKVITNASSMLQAMQAGQVDVAQGDSSTAESASRAGLTITHAPAVFNAMFFLDHSGTISKPLADSRVRQALNYAVDRTSVTAASTGGLGGTPTSAWEPLDLRGLDPTYKNYYPYDPEKAKSLLAEAGYPGGFQFSVLCNGASMNYVAKMCQAVAEDYRRIGVNLQIANPATSAEAQQEFSSGKFAALISPWSITPTWVDTSTFLEPNGALNQHGWKDPIIDQIWQSSTSEPVEQQASSWKSIVERTITEAYLVPLLQSNLYYYASKSIGGVAVTTAADLFRPIATDWFAK